MPDTSKATPPLTVHVLTHCVDPLLAYGSLLVFGSIRTGFPTARIEVVDNGSCEAMVPRIRAAAESVGASFEARPLVHYADHWHRNLFQREWPQHDAPVVFVDPDVVFWKDCEGWDFGEALMAGHLQEFVPAGARHPAVSARLHPSFLWVASISRLRQALPDGSIKHVGCWTEVVAGAITYHNTLGPLYAAVQERCASFGEAELDSFDHLQSGAQLPAIFKSLAYSVLDGQLHPALAAHLAAAAGEVASLRGLWRRREAATELFRHQPVNLRSGVMQALRDAQGQDATDEHMAAVEQNLRARIQFGGQQWQAQVRRQVTPGGLAG